MSNILKSCLVSISLVAIFTNNGYTSTNQPLSNINSNITIEKLQEYTQLFRQMRKYKAQLEGKQDSNQVISVDDALKKYHVLSKIINLDNSINYNTIASDASKIIDNIYNTICDYEKGTGIVNPVFKLMAQSDDQIDIKTLPQEQFLVNFNKYFKQIVSTLLREQCAFISDYSPSNTKNTDVVNLFIIAWHVVIKYAQDNGYPEIETMLLQFFDSTPTGIRINSDWIGISSNSMFHNNNMITNNIQSEFNNNNMNNSKFNNNNMNNSKFNNNNMNNSNNNMINNFNNNIIRNNEILSVKPSINMNIQMLKNCINTNNQQHAKATEIDLPCLEKMELYDDDWIPNPDSIINSLLQENIEFINNWDYEHNKDTYKRFSQAWDKVLTYLDDNQDKALHSNVKEVNEKILKDYNTGQYKSDNANNIDNNINNNIQNDD